MATHWQVSDKIRNRWQIHRILGGPAKSGMGIVYVVYDHELREAFAAKTFQDRFLGSRAARDLFIQEAHTWVSLDYHPNIVRAYFVESIHGRPYIFLEYVPDGDLSHWIGTPRLTVERALRFAIQFCYGMEYACSKGIRAHRDIKPENCLIAQGMMLKITDFGLARVATMEQREGGRGGTPKYMPPEQWDNFERADERSDIYSFGGMLYEMLTGHPPFGKRPEVSNRELEQRHKEEEPPALDSELSTLNSIIQTCLQKIPGERYESFYEVREQLMHALQQVAMEKVSAAQGVKVEVLDFNLQWALLSHESVMKGIGLKAGALNSKGSSLNYLKKYDEALPVLERALQRIDAEKTLQSNHLHAMIYNNMGYALMHLGRRGEALTCFDAALRIDPRNFPALTNKGQLLFESEDLHGALECGDRALSVEPHSALAWNNRGRTLHAMGKLDEAQASYEKALAIDPRLTRALGNMGGIMAEKGRHEESLVWFDRALAIDPLYDEVLNSRAISLAARSRYKGALICLKKALETSPKNGVFWQNMGTVLLQLERYQEALNAFDKALEIDPGLRIARQGRATCRMMLQERGTGMNDKLQESVEWHNKGKLLHQFGQCEEAISCLDHSLVTIPLNELAWYDKGNSLRFLGRHHEAIACYKRAVSIDARFADAWGNMGVSYGQLGQHEEALKCFEQALQINLQDAHWWVMKGSALQDLGREQEAEACYTRAEAIDPNLRVRRKRT